jgi:hypothetical protein
VNARVIVCGSRNWRSHRVIHERLLRLGPLTTIVHGACPDGADSIAAAIAQAIGFDLDPHPADWQSNGRSAGPIRNREMAEAGADLCIAFWDGRSVGTAHMIEEAVKHGIPVEIHSEPAA